MKVDKRAEWCYLRPPQVGGLGEGACAYIVGSLKVSPFVRCGRDATHFTWDVLGGKVPYCETHAADMRAAGAEPQPTEGGPNEW